MRVLAAFTLREMCGWLGMTLKNYLDIQAKLSGGKLNISI